MMPTYFAAYALALAAEVGDRHLPLLRAELAIDLELDRQAVTVPARHVGRIEARHAARLHHEILEDLVERRADVDLAVGVRRAVVQHELRRAFAGTAELAVQVHLLPASDRLRLSRLQIGLHREGGSRQVARVLPLGHGSLSIVIMARMAVSRLELAAPAVREAVLDNGLKVLVQEVHTAPLASVWCWYKVGSKDEGPGLTGVSHWVEHMNFKGTRNIPRDQVKGIIEQFGGTWNGYTWIDQTTYLETASRDALDRMLFIEAERMSSCLYEPDDCESERTVIISELKGGENDPEQLLDIELTAAAFRVHPYQHPTIGWLRDLETMTRDDLYGHYRRYYVPNNATLVIVGDVDTDDVLRAGRASLRLDSGGQRTAARRGRVEPPQQAERRVHFRKEGTTAYWRAAFHAPAFGDADFFPMLFRRRGADAARRAEHLVGPQRADAAAQRPAVSRARRHRAGVQRRRRAAADRASVPLLPLGDGGRGPDAAGGRRRDAARARPRRRATGSPSRSSRRSARSCARASSTTATASPTSRTSSDTSRRSTAGRPITELIPRLATVTLDQVNAAARRYLTPDNRTIGWFEPIARLRACHALDRTLRR